MQHNEVNKLKDISDLDSLKLIIRESVKQGKGSVQVNFSHASKVYVKELAKCVIFIDGVKGVGGLTKDSFTITLAKHNLDYLR